MPGGESTTLRRLMDLYGFKEALKQSDLPMFGTCAGLIVLAKDVEGESGYLKSWILQSNVIHLVVKLIVLNRNLI